MSFNSDFGCLLKIILTKLILINSLKGYNLS